MLPNLKIVICAVMFAVIAFAVTGAGVHLPETYTRIGEMPEIGRPMMQRMITDEPAQARFHILTLTRRNEELGQLRQRAALEVAPVFAPEKPEPDVLMPAVVEVPDPGTIVATVEAPLPLEPSGAIGMAQALAAGTASGSIPAPPAAATPDGAPEVAVPDATVPATPPDTEPVRVAALPAAADAEPPAPSPAPQVKLRRLRPAAKASPRHSFRRVHRFARVQPNVIGAQGLFGQPFQSH
jgi:hypothetical protein